MSEAMGIRADCLVPGTAEGRIVVLDTPLSLWGGLDLETGTVADVNHPAHGARIAGRILAMPGGRGSSSSSSVLVESARLGRHPLAIVITERDPILAVGSLVAEALYGVSIPLVRMTAGQFSQLSDGSRVRVAAKPGKCRVTVL